ncbi:hypothetical protein TNCV_1488331 [Trichonephila clavipes]|nr:hypothetical protein TNCV_1488331 [Trichonephila clavipes]
MGLQFLFHGRQCTMSSHSSCRTALRVRILNVWIGWHDLRISIPSSMYGIFLGRRLAARTLPPVTIQELRLALQDEWATMPQQLIDTSFLAWEDAAETCLAVRGDHIPPTKDRMFLAVPITGMFRPSVALRSMLLFQSSFFYPSDFSFSKCCLHYMSLRIGDLTVLNELIWKALYKVILKKPSRP